ncbi:acetylornithine aminotransferase [Actinomortierella ambigua]|uniref:acetylornithine transaminase n=1 Tax=Actinomortierella ambigua TaxID=1343610 RepID=A0A9P6Q623_9FUNG|nr:acetylornithine aminotransferase [Actinomortierella ambigua]
MLRQAVARSHRALRVAHPMLRLNSARAMSTKAAEMHFQQPLSHADVDADPKTHAMIEKHAKYTLTTYARPPVVFTHGKGTHVYDVGHREYLDFTAGIAVNALGHADPEVASTLYDQAKRVVHLSNLYYNEPAGELAERLIEATRASGDFEASKIFFSNSGTEANEGAFKFARKYGKMVAEQYGSTPEKKIGIVSFTNAFHGRSMGALSATPNPKYQKPFWPLIPGVVNNAPFNDVDAVDAYVTKDTCAVILEPIQGEGGINVSTEAFLKKLRQRCDEVGALLIFDEIQCGLGRTGKLWAHENYSSDCVPDMLTMAKPLANGFPIGAIMITDKVAEQIKVGEHGTTFGGNPLGCAVANNVFQRINTPEFLDNVLRTGEHFKAQLETLTSSPIVDHVRGQGLILGLRFTVDPAPLVALARERGLLIVTAANNSVRFVPPLNVSKAEVDQGVEILRSAIKAFEDRVLDVEA